MKIYRERIQPNARNSSIEWMRGQLWVVSAKEGAKSEGYCESDYGEREQERGYAVERATARIPETAIVGSGESYQSKDSGSSTHISKASP